MGQLNPPTVPLRLLIAVEKIAEELTGIKERLDVLAKAIQPLQSILKEDQDQRQLDRDDDRLNRVWSRR